MHIFFIRHGETEHNVAGLLAGVTDSRLTNHGVLQTQRLGQGLIKTRGLRFTNVYSSDLQRAYMTAHEICKAQNQVTTSSESIEVVKLEILREQDFGSLELVAWSSKRVDEPIKRENNTDFKPKETRESMKIRADAFIDDHILPLLALDCDEPMRVAIVSHGIFLSHTWRALLSRLSSKSVTVDPEVAPATRSQSLEHMAWSNTGYLEVDVQTSTHDDFRAKDMTSSSQSGHQPRSLLHDAKLTVKSINGKPHLLNMKRARGGIGSAAHDQRQQNLNTFFKKRKRASSEVTSPQKTPKTVDRTTETIAADPKVA